MRKTLAVLLPIYKGDKLDFLKEAVESLFKQTFIDFDILLLIDGPVGTDILEYLEFLSLKDNILLFKFSQNRGLPFVLNEGIEFGFDKGYEFLARMDADDISINTRFENQINYLKINSDVDVVGGAIIEFNEKGEDIKLVKYPKTNSECFDFFKKRNPIPHAAAMFRISFFKKAGLYSLSHVNYKKWEDTILWYNGFKNKCVFANLEEVVYKVRTFEVFFKTRRSGFKRAYYFFVDKFKIIKDLKLGLGAYFYLFVYCVLILSPVFLKKFAYKILR